MSSGALNQLYERISSEYEANDKVEGLRPVLGGGQTNRPHAALVFINPTPSNVSVQEEWAGPSQPFVGMRHFWRVMRNGGILPQSAFAKIDRPGPWSPQDQAECYAAVADAGWYFTNLVKATGPNGDAPPKDQVERYLEFFIEEINLVKPKAVITFGQLPTKTLTGQLVKMSEVLDAATSGMPVTIRHQDLVAPVYPCHFPVGRGSPKKAAAILRSIRNSLIDGAPFENPEQPEPRLFDN